MIGFLARRLALAVSMVWAITFLAFISFGLAFDPTAQYDACLSPLCAKSKAALIDHFHLHAPILERYWYWLTGLFQHGFGDSTANFSFYSPPLPIGPEVWHATWATVQLLVVSLVLVAAGSLALGFVSSRFADSPIDWIARLGSYVAWSVPPFLMGVILIRVFQPTGWFNLDHSGRGFDSWLRWIVPPAVALALGFIGLYGRYIRSEMLENSSRPYADVARGKGLSEQQVAARHVLRNSLLPVVSLVSLDFAAIVGATLAIDYVFRLDGIAGLFLYSTYQLDPFLLTAILFVIAAIVACGMFISDAALGLLDPRLRAARSL